MHSLFYGLCWLLLTNNNAMCQSEPSSQHDHIYYDDIYTEVKASADTAENMNSIHHTEKNIYNDSLKSQVFSGAQSSYQNEILFYLINKTRALWVHLILSARRVYSITTRTKDELASRLWKSVKRHCFGILSSAKSLGSVLLVNVLLRVEATRLLLVNVLSVLTVYYTYAIAHEVLEIMYQFENYQTKRLINREKLVSTVENIVSFVLVLFLILFIALRSSL